MLLPYGNESIEVALPNSIEADIIQYRLPEEISGNEEAIIQRALEHPISSPALRDMAIGHSNAVILISDISRLCPSYKFLPFLLDELNAGGITDQQITIVVALGLHRRQTDDELRKLTGAAYHRVQVVNHCALPEMCTYVGTTQLGTEIELNKLVVEADLRIATGNIEPHRLVGISGGAKALFPGVASSRSIEQNHSLSHRYKASPGLADNPIHQDITEVLNFTPIDFLFNVVVTHQRVVVGAVAGNLQDAHRQGAELARACFLVPVSRRYDLIITSTGGYPKDMQLYQAVKTLQNAAEIANPGAEILLLARCQELYGNGTFELWVETMGDIQTTAEMLKQKFVIGAHKIEHIVKVIKDYKVNLYSDVPEPIVRLLGFEPVADLKGFLAERCSASASKPTVAVMPYGSITYPVYF